MALYYYEKYKTSISYGPWSDEKTTDGTSGQRLSAFRGYSKPPKWNGSFYSFSGLSEDITPSNVKVGTVYYDKIYGGSDTSESYYKKTVKELPANEDLFVLVPYIRYYRTRSKSTTKGTFIETIKAEDGTYPNDGVKEGYWYVKKGLVNKPPVLNLTTLNSLILHEKDQLPIAGDVTDTDVGNVVTVKYQINSTTVRNVKAYVSTGAKETFDKPLTFRGGNLYDGSTLVASHLAEGVNHSLKVWAEDDQGGKSEIATRTFKVITNRPPVLAITSTPIANNLLDEDTITIEGTATDPDDNAMTLTAQIHDVTETIPIDNNGQWSFSFALNLLKDGDNLITFTLADQYQVTDTARVKVTRNAQRTYTQNVAMRLAVSSPEDIDTLIMWIKRGAADNKLRAMISIDKPGEEQNFVVMEKRETISNIAGSAVHEDEFFFTGTKEGQATIKMTNVDGMRIIMGATSNESKTT